MRPVAALSTGAFLLSQSEGAATSKTGSVWHVDGGDMQGLHHASGSNFCSLSKLVLSVPLLMGKTLIMDVGI